MTELTDLSETDGSNTLITGANIAEGCPPSGINNAIRNMAGLIRRAFKASIFRVRDTADQTKLLALDLSGITTATTRTLVVPDKNGTLSVNVGRGAFRGWRNTDQAVGAGSTTKVQIDNETFDPENWFNTTTHRYTPQVAGYYQVSASIKADSAGPDTAQAIIYKNGATEIEGTYGIWADSGTPAWSQVSGLVYLNGSTDYIELFAYVSGTSIKGGTTTTYFCAFLASAA